ncbi:MAG: CPBP family intramembrane glutamic endopeptidase [Promethearchaeota archaeon]
MSPNSSQIKKNRNNEGIPKSHSINSLVGARLFLFAEIIIILVIQYIIYFIIISLSKINLNSSSVNDSILIYYVFPLIALILGVYISLIVFQHIFKGRYTFPSPENKTPLFEVFSIFKITKKNLKFQLIYFILILFLVFIPLDFIGYLIPGVLDFSVNALLQNENGISPSQLFFTETNYFYFLLYSVIVYLIVAFREEFFFRIVSISRGRRYIGDSSAVFLFAFAFGLSHLIYIVTSSNFSRDISSALVWGVSAYIIALITGIFFIKKRYFYPLWGAHAFNNIISATTLYLYQFKSIPFKNIALFVYIPCICITIILIIVFRNTINSSFSQFRKTIKNYAKENKGFVFYMILFDIGIAIIIFFFSLFFF